MRVKWAVGCWLIATAGCTGATDTDTGVLDGDPTTTDADVTDDTTRQSPTGTSGDTGTTTQDCSVGPVPTGPWASHPIGESGATVTSKDYTNDAGLAAVRKAALAATSETTVSLAVTDATVVAKGFVPASGTFAKFWVQDSSGPMVAFNVDVPDAAGLAPGDVVSFTATKVQTFFDLPQISEVSDFTVAKAQGEVKVIDGNDTTLDYATHGEQLVEAWGELVSDNGPCGGDYTCYDITAGTQTLVFRTESKFQQVGDCMHFIGPLQNFNGTLQLTVEDFDWATDY